MRKKIDGYAISAFATTFLISLLLLKSGHSWGGDFAQYIVQARVMMNGTLQQWQEKSYYMISNSPLGMGVEIAPWGYSFFLMPLMLVFGENLTVFKIANCVLLGLNTLLLYGILKRQFSAKCSFFVSLCFGLSYAYLSYGDTVLSDILFTTLILAATYAFAGLISGVKEKRVRYSVGYALAAYGAYLTKSQGIVLYGTLFFWQMTMLIRNGKPDRDTLRVHILPYVLTLVLFVCISMQLPKGHGSSLYFLKAMTLDLLKHNFIEYVGITRYFLPFAYEFEMGNKVLYIFFLAICIYGLKKDRFQIFMNFFFVFMMCVLMVFPWASPRRYMLPVLPFFFMYFAYGLQKIYVKKEMAAKTALSVLFVLSCADISTRVVQNQASGRIWDGGSRTPEALDIYDYINENIPMEDEVLFVKPRVIYMYTGHVSYAINETNMDKIKEGQYFLDLTYEPTEDIAEQIRFFKDCELKLVYNNARFNLYRVVSTGR